MFHIQILTEVSPHSKSSAARHAGSSPARGTMIAARRASRVACKQWYTVYDAALAFSEGTAMTAYRFQRREFLQAAPVVAGGLAFAPGAGRHPRSSLRSRAPPFRWGAIIRCGRRRSGM